MRIISYEQLGDSISLIVETDTEYRSLIISRDNQQNPDHSYPRSDFQSLEHFADVIGKFNPYTFILREPIEIDAITYNQVEKAIA
jgi:hypothetical protein